MRIAIAGLALLMLTGPAFADEPVPTEGGDPVGNTDSDSDTDTGPAPDGRIGGYPDGGTSSPGYSNPEGTWTTEDGSTFCCTPGMSQDWYESTGIYGPVVKNGPAAARQSPESGNRSNGGGHDR